MSENEAIKYFKMATDEAGNEEFSDVYKEMCGMAIQALTEIQAYRAIGTVEELKALKEKRTAKSRRIVAGKYFCPECGRTADMGYCKACGQNLY